MTTAVMMESQMIHGRLAMCLSISFLNNEDIMIQPSKGGNGSTLNTAKKILMGKNRKTPTQSICINIGAPGSIY
jgi:hypothetical protein